MHPSPCSVSTLVKTAVHKTRLIDPPPPGAADGTCREVSGRMTNADAMLELCTLMLEGQLSSDVFAQWVARHYGDPKVLTSGDLEAIVQDFDRCLAPPVVELCEDDFADDAQLMARAS